jgi:hypothetical protein
VIVSNCIESRSPVGVVGIAKPYQRLLAPDVLSYTNAFKEFLSIDWPRFKLFTKEPGPEFFLTSIN